jgi:hypothetical protein
MTDENESDESYSGADGTVRTQITPDEEAAEFDFLEIVAELEGREMDELPSLYTEVDHLLETLFQTPPSQQSQVKISFSYAGYRITIDQQGGIELIPVKKSDDW